MGGFGIHIKKSEISNIPTIFSEAGFNCQEIVSKEKDTDKTYICYDANGDKYCKLLIHYPNSPEMDCLVVPIGKNAKATRKSYDIFEKYIKTK